MFVVAEVKSLVTPNVIDYVLFFGAVGGLFALIWYFMGVDTGNNRYIGPKDILKFLAINRVTQFVSRHLLVISACSLILVGVTEIVTPFVNGTFPEPIYYGPAAIRNSTSLLKEADHSGGQSIMLGTILLIIGIVLACVKVFSKRKQISQIYENSQKSQTGT
jgi:hypothetical protein